MDQVISFIRSLEEISQEDQSSILNQNQTFAKPGSFQILRNPVKLPRVLDPRDRIPNPFRNISEMQLNFFRIQVNYRDEP